MFSQELAASLDERAVVEEDPQAGGFAIGGKLVWGWMMDHLTAKLTVMCAVTAYLTSTLIFLATKDYLWITLAAGLFGLGFGGMVPVRSVLISRLFGVEKFSRVNGLLSFFLAPATFWVLITGLIADQTGTLEEGKMADVVIWDGNPFSVYTHAEQVFVDGALVYDRNDPARQPKSDFTLGIQEVDGEIL